jgi:conjugative transfer region protein TrbK
MNPMRSLALVVVVLAAVASLAVTAQTGTEKKPCPGQLAKELDRCRQLNEKAVGDARCEAAYAENRKRFFTPPAAYHPVPIQMAPGVPEPKLDKPAPPAKGG